jgi:hypothetical protein
LPALPETKFLRRSVHELSTLFSEVAENRPLLLFVGRLRKLLEQKLGEQFGILFRK